MANTGAALLPDIGELTYNTVTFSSLFKSEVNGKPMPDEANRTTKCMEWTLEVEGVVTLNPADTTTDITMIQLRKLLTTPGGALKYIGRGFGSLIVNVPGNVLRDVAWGPIPKLMDFNPLGAGRGAFVKWSVSTQIPEFKNISNLGGAPTIGGPTLRTFGAPTLAPVLQYNYESAVTFDEDQYSHLSIKGTIEIPLTRKTVDDRTLNDIVDAYRQSYLDIRVDLDQFRVVSRDFRTSRDKRTIEWEFQAEELPIMGLPIFATGARGTYSVRNLLPGPGMLSGLVQWTCSLTATYVIRKDRPRRMALLAFYALLWFRMRCSQNGQLPFINDPANGPQQAAPGNIAWGKQLQAPTPENFTINDAIRYYQNLFQNMRAKEVGQDTREWAAIPYHFSFDEGLYQDSRTVTFHCTWQIFSNWQSVIQASGIWRWYGSNEDGNIWAASIKDVVGWRSWLTNRLDKNTDVIVDLGGGKPLLVS
jgi:hypothetical protein